MSGLEVRADSAAYVRAGRALREAGDKTVKNAWAAAIRKASKPVGQQVIRSAGQELPQRGGLGQRVAAVKVGVSAAALRATVNLRSAEGYDLAAIDRGVLRHPVFARKGKRTAWVGQRVRAGAFSRPFDEQAPVLRDQVAAATQDALRQLANRT